MPRLLVHVEGQTEENFVNDVLRDYLLRQGYAAVGARIVGNNRQRRQRGGIRGWPSVRKEIVAHLREDPEVIATTMVDYYGLPQSGEKGWPGRAEASRRLVHTEKAALVESALLRDVVTEMGHRFNPQRFVPYVVMHEFEGLLFSDCAAFSRAIGRPKLEGDFHLIRDQFDTPEEINDSPDTAPSKRIAVLVPGYEKPLLGLLAALDIGLSPIRAECPHFNDWVARLESLAQ